MLTNPRLKLLPDGPFIEVDGGSLYLGRDCHLVMSIPALKNKVVSNRHCCIKREADGRWTLEDSGSTNGTWLRDARVRRREVLVSGDVVSLGRNGPRFLCELPLPVDAGATLKEDDLPAAATALESPDGSAERPYKVGKTPEVALRHGRTGQELSARGYTIVIGRDPAAAQIVIRSDDQKQVSSRHAQIHFRSDRSVVVRDLGSRNGTWVNEKRLNREVALRVGDKLVLGAPATTLLVARLDM